MEKAQDEKQRNRIPSQILKGQDQISLMKPKAILVLGFSFSGKTSLAYHITGGLRVQPLTNGSSVYHPKQLCRHASISEKNDLLVKPPNCFPFQDATLVDCTSFLNYNKMETSIPSHYFFSKIFEKADEFKFVLTINMTALQNAKAAEYTNLVTRFLSLFNFGERGPEILARSCCLVVTRWVQLWKKEHIFGKLKVLHEVAREGPIKTLMEILARPENVFIFENASLNPSEEHGRELGKQIDKSLEYWRKQPGMLNPRVMMTSLPEAEKTLTKDYIKKMNQTIVEAFQTTCSIIDNLKKRLVDPKAGSNPDFNTWLDKIPETDHYQDRRYDFGELQKKPKYFNELKFIKWAIEVVKKSEVIGNTQKCTLDEAKKLFVRILRLFVSILNLTEKEIKIIQQICYITLQKIEQSRLLVIQDKQNPDKQIRIPISPSDIVSRLIGFCDNEEQIEQKFIEKLQLPIGRQDDYYAEAQILIEKYATKNKALYNKLSRLSSLRSKLHADRSEDLEACQYIIQGIRSSEKFNEQANKQDFMVVQVDLYRSLGELCYKFGLFRQAMQIFKVINHISKVLICFNQLTFKQGQSSNLYMEKGRYLRSNSRIEQALACFQQALSLADEGGKRQIKEEIIGCLEKKGEYILQYRNKLAREEYYNRPNNLNLDAIRNKIMEAKNLPVGRSDGLMCSEMLVGSVSPLTSTMIGRIDKSEFIIDR